LQRCAAQLLAADGQIRKPTLAAYGLSGISVVAVRPETGGRLNAGLFAISLPPGWS
jgi:hypothetical protein